MQLSPVILFTYNRPEHTRKTIESLKLNKLAGQSDLFIYSDGPKKLNDLDLIAVESVRAYLNNISGFKSVKVIERDRNWGLADSIIDGVTQVIESYGTVIVLEDDLITSPYFLTFMNNALGYFQEKKQVWHISGWNFPFDPRGLGDVFFWRLMNCSGGWGTWSDRWQFFEKNPKKLIKEFEKKDVCRFDLSCSGQFWSQVIANSSGEMNTWAIFWYATIFKQHGLCLNPSVSYVRNIGHDGSGVHCGGNYSYLDNTVLNENEQPRFDIPLEESSIAIEKAIQFYREQKLSLPNRIIRILYKLCKKFTINIIGDKNSL